jgi:Arc/MetJ-type ribon-helix-helix transcriptional regulator
MSAYRLCVACAGSSAFPIGSQFRYDLNMARKSRKVKPKKRARPATGKDQLVGVRLPDATIRQIGAWAKREGLASRSDAIRRLIDQSLVTATQASGRRRHKGASKAREWAGREIDRRANQSLPAEERKRRKDRLTKGPSEFREMRDDLPKLKG